MSFAKFFLIIFTSAILTLSAQHQAYAQSEATEPEVSQPDKKSDEIEQEEQKETVEDEPAVSTSQDNSEIDDVEIPEVSYDLAALPFPTRRMRELLLEAAQEGQIEKLRQLIGVGDDATQLSFGGTDGDPIDFLKQESGDDNGHEILAILSEVLEAGYVHLDKGTENELFVWPYFFALPIDNLNDKQKVELFRIVTYGDFQDMKEFGGYIFYRVGISPSGRWEFFVAGD